MTSTTTATRTANAIIEQGRMWFRFAQILDDELRAQGSRLWVKPHLHAQHGLRQSRRLRTHTFVLTTHLEGGEEEVLYEILEQDHAACRELQTELTRDGRLALYTGDGQKLGILSRPAWSWIRPLVELRHTPKFFLSEITIRQGTLTAHVVISHFHEGVEAYLHEHYQQRAQAALA